MFTNTKKYFIILILQFLLVFQYSIAQSLEEEILKFDFKDANEEMNFKDIAGKLRCPTCQGLSVLGSNAPFSNQIKKIVDQKMKEGQSEAQILTYFTERYGYWILREPPKAGLNLLAWIVPLLMVLVGLSVLMYFFRRAPEQALDGKHRSYSEIVEQFKSDIEQLRKKTS